MTVRIHIEHLDVRDLELTPTEQAMLVQSLTEQLRVAYVADPPRRQVGRDRVRVHSELPGRGAGAAAWGRALSSAITTGVDGSMGAGAVR